MIRSSARRSWRRTTAAVTGTGLVAAALSIGVLAPAEAASVVTGGVSDGQGNPISGSLEVYRKDVDDTYDPWTTIYVGPDGYIEGTLSDGVYKFEFDTGDDYVEFYKDKPSLGAADAVTVSGDAPTALGAWTIDQPYIVGSITNSAGKPLSSAEIRTYDSATNTPLAVRYTDERGTFKVATQAAPVKVSFAKEDYALEFYADATDLASATPITATPAGADAGRIVLANGGSVSGRVTSEAGVPLEFVRVSSGGRSDLTDKFGVYTIKNARTGSQTVQFFDQIGEYTTEYFNNTTDLASATPIVVGVGQAVTGIDAALAPKAVDPSRTAEVTGTVKDSLDVPVVGAQLVAYTTPTRSSDRQHIETAYSNRQGAYAFTELEKVQGENQFKIGAGAPEQGDDQAFALFQTWYGGGQDYDRAPVVTITPGTPVGNVNVVLDRAGGIAGSVTGLAGTPLSPSVSVMGSEDGELAFAGVSFEPDSTFESRSLRAGTYKVRFDDHSGFHVGEWWKDESRIDDAVIVTVRSGQLVGGLNAALSNRLAALDRPSLSVDYPWVGKTITADPGVWNVQTGTDFDYEWLVGSAVVGTGKTFTPTKSHLEDRLTLRVVAEAGRLIGTATSPTSAKVGYKPKVKVRTAGGKATIKIKAKPVNTKKVKGVVVVKEIVKVKKNGTIKHKSIAKTKIKKGRGTVSLPQLKKGKHKLVFFFKGLGKVGSNDKSVKIKIKR